MDKIRVFDYFIIGTLLVLSTFEYFFRAEILCNIFLVLCLLIGLFKGMKIRGLSLVLILSIFFIVLLQTVTSINIPLLRAGYITISFLGIYSIAWISKGKFIKVFTNIIVFIATYSMVIYLLSLIPSVNNYLYNTLTPQFPSLNVQDAVFEGGGRNIVIYNFYSNSISDIIGFKRNCGPFWEPGMFAVFINMALLCNLVILNGNWRKNIILILALISTFSAGGYLSLLFILAGYFLLKKKSLTSIISLIVLVFVVSYVMDMEFIGIKLFNQMDNNQIGDDSSRFGAYYTQLKMIADHLIIGGGEISAYATSSKTLASGLLMPLVDYGIFVGTLIYICYYIAFNNISKRSSKIAYSGIFMFSALLLMSFSQTILGSPIFITFLFNGLIVKSYGTI